MRTPQLASRASDGELCCHSRTFATDPPCPSPATWHIAWLLAPRGKFSLVCEEHMEGLAKVYDYVARHPATITCAMPSVGWLNMPGEPSRCVIVPILEPPERRLQ
ncbi:hypothetical protein [Streptomyces sp. 3214.6]|uniref:hypothetical protein n=1 Tax=Streptomyces sp. 3214.6 TaxID=1882757 RepID=UPI000909E4B6|nr:hypothetical protein [Streptomyces sp. 3214.6]SHI67590.1 hypothetical protein SAMN05444521_8207 [Streptomyces sp. 3214.6]